MERQVKRPGIATLLSVASSDAAKECAVHLESGKDEWAFTQAQVAELIRLSNLAGVSALTACKCIALG